MNKIRKASNKIVIVTWHLCMLESIFGFDQSSDFFQLSTNCNKNTLWDPTKYIYIYLESVRRDLSNVEIYKIS